METNHDEKINLFCFRNRIIMMNYFNDFPQINKNMNDNNKTLLRHVSALCLPTDDTHKTDRIHQ